MKNNLFILAICLSLIAKSQTHLSVKPVSTDSSSNSNTIKSSNNNYGWDNRIAFIVGGGASVIITKLYNNPVINRTNNAVIIEESGKCKPNLTFGIVFTPFVKSVARKVSVVENEQIKEKKLIEYYPKGITLALFVNPVSIAKVSENFSNTIDLGGGIGYRSGNFSILGTIEFFSIRQPRSYFVNQFKDNNTTYIINNQLQTAIDPNDNSVFKSVTATAVGIKFCYTFDVIKSYYKTATELAK